MSLRKLASSLSKNKDKSRGTSSSSTASWSPSNSRSHTPLASSVSLPDSASTSSLQRYSSASTSTHSQHSTGSTYNPNQTPLRIVAPFATIAPPEARESTSSLGSNETRDSETATLRLKRSLTKLLSPKDSESTFSPSYTGPAPVIKLKEGTRSRKGSIQGSDGQSDASFFNDPNASTSRPSTSTSSTKRLVSWIGQSNMAKKVQDALKSNNGSTSSLPVSRPPPMGGRISGEYHDDEDDRSSISSAASFVQNAPEDDFSRILSEPDIPAMQMNQAPFQIPAEVYLPRSHTNLHALTLASLAFPPSPHPLLYNPHLPAFPRSSNPPSKLPRLPTFRAHLAKTRILDRLEAQNLTHAENESILPFGRKEQTTPGNNNQPVLTEGEQEEGRKINDSPGQSVGLEAWTRRPPFMQRARVWQYDSSSGTRFKSGDGDDIRYEAISHSRNLRTELKFTGGIRALAGLVMARPDSRELPDLPVSAPPSISALSPAPIIAPPSIVESISPRSLNSSLVIDESMLIDPSEAVPQFTHSTTAIALLPAPSPRPLPSIPSLTDVQTIPSGINNGQRTELPDDGSPIIPVRPLPPRPRPLPVPPVAVSTPSPRVSIDELESIDGPVVALHTIDNSASQTQFLSPPSSAHGHTVMSHSQTNGPSSSTITSAPNTPLDPLDTESVRRLSIGSMSIIMPAPSIFSLEEMDGLEATSPHDLDNRRRSVVSLKMSVHKRLSMASRASRASSPSIRNHPLPPVSESSRHSESSHFSSRHTPNGSATPSMEKLQRRTNPSMSSLSFEPSEPQEQNTSIPSSPVVVVEPLQPVIENVKGEEQARLEPSPMSEEIDPFILQKQSIGGLSDTKLELVLNGKPSPIITNAEVTRLLSPELPHLSLATTDLPTSAGLKTDQRSIGAGSPPGGSVQSPSTSDSAGLSDSAAPVRFVKLKRSGSQMASETSLGNGSPSSAGTGRSLQRALKDPSKFWPHNRRVDEEGEQSTSGEPCIMARTSFAEERKSLVEPSESMSSSAPSRVSGSQGSDKAGTTSLSGDMELTDATQPAMNHDGDDPLTSLPLSIALDVARLSDTSRLDLTLFNFQSTSDAPRSSISSHLSESETARAASVKEIAANMSVLPSTPTGRLTTQTRHHRTHSNERAARIEAHLNSVSSSRNRPSTAPQRRPDFLPYPGTRPHPNGGPHLMRQSSEDSLGGSLRGYASDSYDAEMSGDDPMTPPPNGSFVMRGPPPPSRWASPDWRRPSNTLPLPSASILPSATRPVPAGRALNRTGSIMSSSTPAILRGTAHSQSHTVRGRTLRM
ncbi:hypothetical protein PIIN_08776 [Serendipita indica DSM 11827]|uniref:Uncharacterized protein n=1 Tax=Serendipita indica (strain DSM 11827) TaxID=1109443 RepID=G4TU14_SERID|nr:hypothetical protein PIIN_08776 [Serendipita indica DSM 11827]